MPRLPLTLILLALALLVPASAAIAQACGPTTTPTFDSAIPTWDEVNGYPLGSKQATTAELYAYLDAIHGAAPTRTILRSMGKSHRGRELMYLAISAPDEIARLEETAAEMRDLRLARRTAAEAAAIAAERPAIAWVSSNVHGNEPSGADGSMQLIYELVARTDCWNERRLNDVVTFFQPTQNPDGREAATRTNRYGFDMNRDWFARSQPESDTKVETLHRYPGVFYIDAHEQGGTAGFFPPNADPIHHEISDTALSHINDVYGPAIHKAATEAGYDFTNYTSYDLFAMIYGDTVPSTAFGAAGMTFEKGGQSPYTEKQFEQYTNQRASLDALTLQKTKLITEWAGQFHEAIAQGAAGQLEPNLVVQPDNEVAFPVPQQKIYGYFLRTDAHSGDAAKLVDRLRALDVEVHRVVEATTVPAVREFGRPTAQAADTVIPEGSFWVPMAQSQKHWVQALLGEDPFVPYAYFYDVSGWSNPALMGLRAGIATQPLPAGVALSPVNTQWVYGSVPSHEAVGGYTFDGDSSGALTAAIALLKEGIDLRRVSEASVTAGTRTLPRGTIIVPAQVSLTRLGELSRKHELRILGLEAPVPTAGTVALQEPKVALLAADGPTEFVLRHMLGVTPLTLSTNDLSAGALTADFTAIVVPDVGTAASGLNPIALASLQLFVRGGGTYLGFGNVGLQVARASGFTTAATQPVSGLTVPGTPTAVTVDPGASPVAWGLSTRDFVFNTSDPIIAPGSSDGTEVAKYPPVSDAYVGGYTRGTDALAGTPVLIDDAVDAGRALLFAFDPVFRAWSESGIRMFANGLLYPGSSSLTRRVTDRRARRQGARGLRPVELAHQFPLGRDAVIEVALTHVGTLERIVRARGLPRGSRIQRDLRSAQLRIPNPRGLDVHESTWVPKVLERLHRDGVRPRLVIL